MITAEPKKWQRRLKGSLKENKIYFDTIAAILLSIMAIILSTNQYLIMVNQDMSRRSELVSKRRSDFSLINDMFIELFFTKYQLFESNKINDKISNNDKQIYYQNILNALRNIEKNPILLGDIESFTLWQKAKKSAFMLANYYAQRDPNIYNKFIENEHLQLYNNAYEVYKRLTQDKNILKKLLTEEEQKNITIH